MKSTIPAILTALGLTIIVSAQDDKKVPEQVRRIIQAGPQGILNRLDKNKDKKISRAEASQHLKRGFNRLDKDKDGQLNRQELAVMINDLRTRFGIKKPATDQPNPQIAQQFRRLLQQADKDKDGKINKAEAKARQQLSRNFDRIDANKDGFLDRTELTRVIARAVQGQGNDNRPGRPGVGRQAVDFDTFDLNADGRLTREELARTRFFARFAELDTDKSGKIDPKEFRAVLKK